MTLARDAVGDTILLSGENWYEYRYGPVHARGTRIEGQPWESASVR